MTSSLSKQTKARLHLALTVAQKKNLERLQQELQLDSVSETIRFAVRLLDSLSSRIKEGQKIAVRYPDGDFKEISLTELEIPLSNPLDDEAFG